MTSKLRAKKFRVPRPDVLDAVDASLGVTEGNPELAKAVAPAPQQPAINVASLDDQVAQPLKAPIGSTDFDEIRKEGLTGRQLRMARRTAQRHDLPATSDFDTVRLLRQAGIDPFQRSNLLELAAREVIRRKISYSPEDMFPQLLRYLGNLQHLLLLLKL